MEEKIAILQKKDENIGFQLNHSFCRKLAKIDNIRDHNIDPRFQHNFLHFTFRYRFPTYATTPSKKVLEQGDQIGSSFAV
jgi:hypothetical protein